MTVLDFRHRRDLAVHADWQPFDRLLQRWVLAHGGSLALATLAARCSWAEAQGDSAVRIEESATELLAQPLCSDGSAAAPFVIDGEHFYFWRNYAAEVAIASDLATRCTLESDDYADSADAWLEALFAGSDADASAGQRAAVIAAVRHRLLILSGGPGTGKTSTVLRILLMLQRLSPQPLTVRVAAPTGKAAQRLLQALRDGRKLLAAQLGPEWQAALDAIPERDALTLHRLLEFDPRQNRYRRNATRRIAADVVVIDEASMVDLSQLAALLAALPATSRLLLVGDPDQLTSVAAGAVLSDLGRVMTRTAQPHWQQLQHVFRAEQPLQGVLRAIQAGDAPSALASFGHAGAAVSRHSVESSPALMAELRRWSEHLLAWQRELPARVEQADQARTALQGFAHRQLLCALREGEFGSLACHRVIEQRLRQHLGIAIGQVWYAGRAVMITRNDYGHGLFNGDIGITLPDAQGRLQVWFESADGSGSARSFPVNALPEHEGAFALTIHKSQGSEYNEVAVLLPPQADQRILSRQLLYTGLSRARRRIELWSGEAALRAALEHDAPRASGLAERLQRLLTG